MINEYDKCFQYVVTVALSYGEIKSHPEKVSNIKPFINKYKWKKINYASKMDDLKTFEKNNPTIALDVSYIKEKEICPGYISKNLNCEKQINLLKVPNKEKEGWNYRTVKTYLHYEKE